MKKKNGSAAIKQFEKVRRLAARSNSPLRKMTEAQIIAKLRKTREEIWREEIGLRPRQ